MAHTPTKKWSGVRTTGVLALKQVPGVENIPLDPKGERIGTIEFF